MTTIQATAAATTEAQAKAAWDIDKAGAEIATHYGLTDWPKPGSDPAKAVSLARAIQSHLGRWAILDIARELNALMYR